RKLTGSGGLAHVRSPGCIDNHAFGVAQLHMGGSRCNLQGTLAASLFRQSGDRVMKAKDVMTTSVVTIGTGASAAEAAELMVQHRISGLPVVDRGGNIVGNRDRR